MKANSRNDIGFVKLKSVNECQKKHSPIRNYFGLFF